MDINQVEVQIILFQNKVKQLKESLKQYEDNFLGRRVHLSLADGDNIYLVFSNRIICHLLGVQYSYLENHLLFQTLSSYGSIKYICENPEVIEKEIRLGNLDVHQMFSNECDKKNLSIQKIPNLGKNFLNQIEFVCPYNKKIAIETSEKKPIQSDYIVGIRNQNKDISILGIIKNENSSFYINSNLLIQKGIDQFKELKNIIGYQTLTCVNYIQIYDFISYKECGLFYLSEDEKLSKINTLKYFGKYLKTKIDVTAEAERQLKETQKGKEFKKETLELLDLIRDKIVLGEKIELSEYKDLGRKQTEMILLVNQLIDRVNIAESTVEKIIGVNEEYTKKKRMIPNYRVK